MENYCKHDDPG